MPSKRVNAGRDRVRDFLSGDVKEIAVGTGATNRPSVTDTSLENEVARKTATGSNDGTGKALYVMRLNTGDANGNTLKEAGVISDDDALATRHTYADTPKTSSDEIEFQIQESVVNP